MPITLGTVHSVETIKANDRDPLQFAAVYFTLSGTYAQGDNSELENVATLIQNSRRNGRSVALKSVALWQPARKESNPKALMGLKTLAIASADVTFEVTDAALPGDLDLSTELANGTVPEQDVPFGILVGFTES